MSPDPSTRLLSEMTKTTAFGLLVLLGALGSLPDRARAQTVAWEARWDGGMVDSNAQASFVTTGPTGEIFATGIVRNGTFRDILTLAWSASGELLWQRTKGISADSDDVPAGIVVNGEGRVVVAGTTKKSGTESVVAFAYDANGSELWSRSHPLPAFRLNQARGLALGPEDRILIAAAIGNGSIQGTSLMSLASNGDLVWERQWNLDPAYGALSVDPGGVVAVAGRGVGTGNFGFLTVAFDPTGSEIWAKTKNGPAGGTDSVTGLITDSNGRFVVTGAGKTLAAADDFMTVVYDASGNELWTTLTGTSESEAPRALAADSSGNVYVVGEPTVSTATDYTLAVSYDSAGAERWAVTRVDPPDSVSSVLDATISPQGHLIVAGGVSIGSPPMGRLKVTVLAADSGALGWEEARVPALDYSELAFGGSSDPTGALVLVGSSWRGNSIGDVLAVRYDSSGNEVWARKEPLIPTADVPGGIESDRGSKALATGYEGWVYITGSSFNGRSMDYLTVAYDGLGHKIWEARKSNPNDYPARPSAIAVDPISGNVYVTGTTLTQSGNGYLTVAYDRTGAEVWSRTRLEDGYGPKSACCIAVGLNGRIFVSGRTAENPGGTGPDILTIAYESGGNEVWSDGWGLTPFSIDDIGSLVSSSSGAIYIAGTASEDGAVKAMVLAYDTAGNRLWSESHAATGGGESSFSAAAPTLDGGVVAAGSTASVLADILTVAYRPDGSERWSSTVDSAAGWADSAVAVAEDVFGRTYVAGVSFDAAFTESAFLTLALDSNGSTSWSRTRSGIPGEFDLAASLSVSSRGAIFVTGASSNGLNSDFLTVAYSPGGHELFDYRYDGGDEDYGYLSVAGPDGSVFVGGASTLNDRDYFVFQLLDQTRLFADGFGSGDISLWSSSVP